LLETENLVDVLIVASASPRTTNILSGHVDHLNFGGH